MDGGIINQAKAFCPCCSKAHTLDLIVRKTVKRINGSFVRCIAYAYRCNETGKEFETKRMQEDNEARMEETVRRMRQ